MYIKYLKSLWISIFRLHEHFRLHAHSVSRFWATGSLVSGKLWLFFPGIFFWGEHLVYIFRKHFGKKALGRWIFAHQRSPDFFNAVVRDAAGGQEIPLEQVVMVGLDQGGMRCSFDRSCHPWVAGRFLNPFLCIMLPKDSTKMGWVFFRQILPSKSNILVNFYVVIPKAIRNIPKMVKLHNTISSPHLALGYPNAINI